MTGERAATSGPLVTVAVCSRDHPSDLARCLESLGRLTYPRLDLLVIDNAPSSEEARTLVEGRFPPVRYVRELRPGLNRARNRAIAEARGEIVAFADDDVVVTEGWIDALVEAFESAPDVAAVTGRVLPLELETDAQRFFEAYGGFDIGAEPRSFRRGVSAERLARSYRAWAIECGTGANMAFRRGFVEEVGGFDPALDVGTPTNGGGDVAMFFRVIKEGHTLRYQPTAVVYHRHRRSLEELREQMAGWGSGLVAWLMASARAYPDERGPLALLGAGWGVRLIGRYLTSFIRPVPFPRHLMVAELRGALEGWGRYLRSRRATDRSHEVIPEGGPRER